MADPTTPPAPQRAPGDRLLRAGAVVMVIGLACTLIAILPLVVPGLTMPSAWWFLSMLTGVGLAMVVVGLLVAARGRSASASGRPASGRSASARENEG